jgi:hypothetical protein
VAPCRFVNTHARALRVSGVLTQDRAVVTTLLFSVTPCVGEHVAEPADVAHVADVGGGQPGSGVRWPPERFGSLRCTLLWASLTRPSPAAAAAPRLP